LRPSVAVLPTGKRGESVTIARAILTFIFREVTHPIPALSAISLITTILPAGPTAIARLIRRILALTRLITLTGVLILDTPTRKIAIQRTCALPSENVDGSQAKKGYD